MVKQLVRDCARIHRKIPLVCRNVFRFYLKALFTEIRHQAMSRGILTGKSFEFCEEQQKKKRLQKIMLRSNNSPQKCVSSVLLLLDVCEEENWLSSMVYSFI